MALNLELNREALETTRHHLLNLPDRAPDWTPDVAIVLGSGLGGLAKLVEKSTSMSFHQIWNWIDPEEGVVGHAKQVIVGNLCGLKVLVFSGRIHCYEDYTVKQSVEPILLAKAMGAKMVLLTNGAGGLTSATKVGVPMVIRSHTKLTDTTPLKGKNNNALGTRFPNMDLAYKPFTELLDQARQEACFSASVGTYGYMAGPQYETDGEVRMLQTLGADAVGMSTVFEAIAAAWMSLPVAAFSLITNVAGGVAGQPVTHAEVTAVGDQAGPKLVTFVESFLHRYRRNINR